MLPSEAPAGRSPAWSVRVSAASARQTPRKHAHTSGPQNFRNEFRINLPAMMAVFLRALPVFVLYLVARRRFIAGLAGMGTK